MSFATARLDWLYSTKEVYIIIPPREKRWTREDKDPVALQAIPVQRHHAYLAGMIFAIFAEFPYLALHIDIARV